MTTMIAQPTFYSPRLVMAILSGAVITFLLFSLMAKLIETEQITEIPQLFDPIGPVTLQLEDEKTITKAPIPPRPEPRKLPPQTAPVEPKDASPSGVKPTFYAGPGLETITVEKQMTIGTGDQSVRPIVRVDPAYPPEAARDGIEGWVALRFSIDSAGNVRDIEIVDAQPKRVFDREARRALAKWKYQPRREQGVAVVQEGLQVMLEFTLQKQ